MADTALTPRQMVEKLEGKLESRSKALRQTKEEATMIGVRDIVVAGAVGAGLAIAESVTPDIEGFDPVVALAGLVGAYGMVRPSGTLKTAATAAFAVASFNLAQELMEE